MRHPSLHALNTFLLEYVHMLNFNLDLELSNPLENSTSALIDAIDNALTAYRNMMEVHADPACKGTGKDLACLAINRLRNIGIYQTSTKTMLHAAIVWMTVRAQSNPSYERMLNEKQVYALIEDAHLTAVGYKVMFRTENNKMFAQILDNDCEELCSVAAEM